MKLSAPLVLGSLFVSLTLSACASMKANSTHTAVCNQLKSDLIFNGSTSITRESEIQNAQTPLQQRNYDKNDC